MIYLRSFLIILGFTVLSVFLHECWHMFGYQNPAMYPVFHDGSTFEVRGITNQYSIFRNEYAAYTVQFFVLLLGVLLAIPGKKTK